MITSPAEAALLRELFELRACFMKTFLKSVIGVVGWQWDSAWRARRLQELDTTMHDVACVQVYITERARTGDAVDAGRLWRRMLADYADLESAAQLCVRTMGADPTFPVS
jgi:hypothetical protein